MALERQSIEKKDFPIGRRGYDPEAVDEHLRVIAIEVEELRHSSRKRSETLASTASDQVRAIVEAAETSAADIQREAEEEAREIRADANAEAQGTREEATTQAREYVGRVSESTSGMMQRLEAMEGELGALIESLRTGGNRLNADLQLLAGNLAEVTEAVSPRPAFERELEEAGAAPAAGESVAVEAMGADSETVAEEASPAGIETYVDAEPGDRSSMAADSESDDTEGARLIALNMALNGTPREETDRYLAENFQLSDRNGLLDEVYTSVEE